jgi:hypothetical protein
MGVMSGIEAGGLRHDWHIPKDSAECAREEGTSAFNLDRRDVTSSSSGQDKDESPKALKFESRSDISGQDWSTMPQTYSNVEARC